MNNINNKLTKEQFKQIRTELQYTQREMAELLGITIRAISYYESGQKPVSKTVSILTKRIYVDEQWYKQFNKLKKYSSLSIYAMIYLCNDK